MDRTTSRDAGRGRQRYEYKPRTTDQMKTRASQQGGAFDSYIKSEIKMFTPPASDNLVRILPPTWKDAEHFGLDVYLHQGIGPDKSSYLCLDKMQIEHGGKFFPADMRGQECPICKERTRAEKSDDPDYAKKLKAGKRVLVWIIDRNEEKEGPLLWSMSWTMDRDICKVAVDKSTGEVLPVDDPEHGYDVSFERKGLGLKTEYFGIAIARRETELGNDRWMDFAMENPLPDALHYYNVEYLQRIFEGGAREPTAGESRGGGDRGGRTPTPVHTWDSIHKMNFDQMADLIQAQGLKIDPQKSKDDMDLADWICEEMKIEKAPAPTARRTLTEAPPAQGEEGSHRERLRGLREEPSGRR